MPTRLGSYTIIMPTNACDFSIAIKINPKLSDCVVLTVAIILAVIGILCHAMYGHSCTITSGHAIGSDDAYISFRYAENLLKGHGLVFNPGEYVEGYSNFLYTLLLLPGFLIGKDFVYPFSVVLNILLLSISLVMYWLYCRETWGQEVANNGVLLLALNPWIWANASTGLETTLILFVTLGAWLSVEKYDQNQSSKSFLALLIFCLLSIISRVDGFILPGVVVLYFLLKKKYLASFKIALIMLFILVLYTIIRLQYYDDVLANTFYNKISGGIFHRIKTGLSFFIHNSIRTGVGVALLLGYFYMVKAKFRGISSNNHFLILFLSCWIFYLIYIGGDIYYERFFVATLPLSNFIILSSINYFSKKYVPLVWFFLLAIPFFSAINDGRFDYGNNKYDCWITLGKYLKDHHSQATLAVDAAGKIPFFSSLYTIDMLGLNDKHIGKMTTHNRGMPGHTKFDPNYVLTKHPVLIAAWISPDLNMAYGLNKNLYLSHYQLKYLLNVSRTNLGKDNIIDVSAMSLPNIQKLIKTNHNYAVLLRRN